MPTRVTLVAICLISLIPHATARSAMAEPIYDASGSWRIDPPAGYLPDGESLATGSVTLTNVRPGNVVPVNGAEITIREYPSGVSEIYQLEANGSTATSSSISVGPPASMQCTVTVTDTVTYRVKEVARRVSGRLFIGRVSFRLGDANEAAYLASLDAALSSVVVP